jgi:predicted HTH transcriptional regulator
LLLAGGSAAEPAKLRNVPDPSGYLVQINELHRQETVSLADGEQPLLAASMSLPLLIEGGENQNVEFKASLLWDYRQQKATKELYTPVMKNIVAFLNSGGGVVLIGVGDEGEILGIEPDLRTLQKQNLDGFENAFNMAFRKMIGDEFRQSVNVTFPEIDGSTICRLTVSPLSEPAYLLYQGDERFYIRAGNASQPLPVSKATNYVRTHFKG